MLTVLMLLGGLITLLLGGEALVRGASDFALRARISPAVIGLVIVAAGTSMPELVVSVGAALKGSPDVSLGNVVGSNIANIGLILGIAALLRPMLVGADAVRLQWPVMLLAACGLHLLARDGMLDRLEGGFLVLALVWFVAWMVRIGRQAAPEERAELADEAKRRAPMSWIASAGAIVAGAALLAGGARAFVEGALQIAALTGVTERVVGLTVVALGTSLPELVTSTIAALRGKHDIAVANVIGSNIFNVLGILGVTALLHPIAVNPAIVAWDDWWMLGLSFLLLPLLWTGMRLSRAEGALLLGLYVVYTTLLVA